MKHYVFLFCLFFNLLSYKAQFQDRFLNNNPAPGTFDDIRNKTNAFFVANPDTAKDGASMAFNRWEYFWETRVGNSNPNINGTFLPAFNALYNILQSPICSAGPYPANWVNIGPGINPFNPQALGIVNSVVFDPVNPLTTFYAGTTNSGLWKTSNAGFTWQCLTESLRLPGLGINDVAINPTNNMEIYIATGVTRLGSYGLGVMKTTDGGLTWNTTGLSFNPANPSNSFITNKLLINPVNTQIVYALVQDKLYKTINGGAQWGGVVPTPIFQLQSSMIFPANTTPCLDPYACSFLTRSLIDIEMKPGDPNTIYISSDDTPNAVFNCGVSCGFAGNNNGGAELWKSTDAGSTWTELTNVTVNGSTALSISNPNINQMDRIEIAVTPFDPNSLFISYGHQNNGGNATQRSPNGGVTWGIPNATPGYAGFVVSPNNITDFYLGSTTLYKTTNGGANWTGISDYDPTPANYVNGGHADIRSLAIVNNAGNDAVLMGNDGGVGYSANGNPPWINVSKTLPITQFFGLASSEKNSNLIIGGTQDNGVFTYNAGSWSFQVIGDAYECAFDYNNPNICYAEANGGINSLSKSINGGATWGSYGQPSGISKTVRPIENNSINNNIYIGYHDIFKTLSDNTFAPSWQQLSDFTANFGVPLNVPLTAISAAPSNSNVIYVCFNGVCGGCNNPTNFFYRTTSGGGLNPADWQDITNNLFSGTGVLNWLPITSIAVNPTKENELWATVGGFTGGLTRVIHSSDYGTTWNDYSTNLPEFPANKIVYEKGSNDGLYLATDVGVFYRNKTMLQWECFNNGNPSNLPVCIVTDLDINYASNTIRAATFGRGIWVSNLACPLTFNLNDNNAYTTFTVFQEAKNNLTSTSSISNASNITYRAGNYVDLKPGFSANANSLNSYFHAFIHNCDIPGNSFRLANLNITKGGNSNTTPMNNYSMINTLQSNKKSNEFSVIPNPNNGNFKLLLDENEEFPKNISVEDLLGKTILSLNNLTSYNYDLSLGNISNGMFIIKVNYSDKTLTKRIIKN